MLSKEVKQGQDTFEPYFVSRRRELTGESDQDRQDAILDAIRFEPLIDRAVVLREGRVVKNGALETHDHGHETEPPARTVRIIEEVRPWK